MESGESTSSQVVAARMSQDRLPLHCASCESEPLERAFGIRSTLLLSTLSCRQLSSVQQQTQSSGQQQQDRRKEPERTPATTNVRVQTLQCAGKSHSLASD